MYRGLAAAKQPVAADRSGRSGPSITTSNSEYGGWFGQNPASRPAYLRAKSETIWRNGSSGAGNAATIQDMMQVLRQNNQVVNSNPVRPGLNHSFNLAGTRAGPTAQASSSETVSNKPDTGGESVSVERHSVSNFPSQTGGITGQLPVTPESQFHENSLQGGGGGSERYSHGMGDVTYAWSHPKVANASSVLASSNQHLQTPLKAAAAAADANKLRLMKSVTSLGLSSEMADRRDDQPLAHQNLKGGPGSVQNGNRIATNVGPIPIWRSRLAENRLRPFESTSGSGQGQGHQVSSVPMPVWTNDAGFRHGVQSDPNQSFLPNRYQMSFIADGRRPVGYRNEFSNAGAAGIEPPEATSGIGPDGAGAASAGLAQRSQEDRTRFDAQRSSANLETVTPVDLQAGLARTRQGTNFDENTAKYARHANISVLDMNNISGAQSKFYPDAYRLNRAGPNLSNNHMDFETQRPRSFGSAEFEIPTNSEPATAENNTFRGSRYTTGPNPAAAPRKSILKKPKSHGGGGLAESGGYYAKRRTDVLSHARHQGALLGVNGPPFAAIENSYSSRRSMDSMQKRVTFRLTE